MKAIEIHHELLIACCRRDAPSGIEDRLVVGLTDPAVRVALGELATRHGVLGLIATTFERSRGGLPLADAVIEDILAPLAVLKRQSALWEMERNRLLVWFARFDRSPLLLKGAALHGTVYPDPVVRRVGDLDVLVKEPEVDSTIRILGEAGYVADGGPDMLEAMRAHHHNARFKHPNGFIVEVHWALAAPTADFRFDLEAIERRSRSVRTSATVPMRVPSSEDTILHLASQNLEDGLTSIRRMVDIDRILAAEPGLDWTYLVEAGERARLRNMLAATLRICRIVLGADLPPAAPALSPPIAHQVSLHRPVATLISGEPRRIAAFELLRFWLMDRWTDRWRLLGHLATGRQAPLEELFLTRRGRVPRHRHWTARGLAATVKLVACQTGVLLASFVRQFSPRRRREFRRWEGVPRGQRQDPGEPRARTA